MKAHHAGIFGDSGGGKTTLAREVFDSAGDRGIAIWVDDVGTELDVEMMTGEISRVGSLDELLGAPTTRIHYKTSGRRDFVDAVDDARTMARAYPGPATVVVDEAHRVMGTGASASDNPLAAGLQEDRDQAVKWVVVDQDPGDLATTPLKQMATYTWVGPWSTFHSPFLDGFLRVDKSILPQSDYRYVVLDKQMTVVREGETKAGYGT